MNTRLRHILLIARGAGLEMLRRRDAAVLGLFAVLLLGFLLVARTVGFENPATATFLLNLSLTLVTGLAQVMTLVMTSRQMPDECEHGTLYPLLARPVRRADILLGKWLAGTLTGVALFGLLALPAWALVPRLEPYHGGTLLQFLALQPGALALIGAGGLAASLLLPRIPGLVLAGAVLFGSGTLLRVTRGFPLLVALPDPGRLNLIVRYTDGAPPLTPAGFGLLLLYALLWSSVLLSVAVHVFERRSL